MNDTDRPEINEERPPEDVFEQMRALHSEAAADASSGGTAPTTEEAARGD